MAWDEVRVEGEAGARPWYYGANGVMWSGSQFVAFGFTQQTARAERKALIITSSEGVTWTRRSTPASVERVFDVAWSGDRFVAAGGPSILVSPDGVTWSAQRITIDGDVTAVTWGSSQFVAVGTQGQSPCRMQQQVPCQPLVMTSPDGVTWIQRSSPASVQQGEGLQDIAWSGNRFVAVSFSTIFTSLDGGTWSAQARPGGGLHAVTWGGGQFAVVGYGISTSPDGITWTERRVSGLFHSGDVAWSGTRFVAVGFRHRGFIAETTEGLIVTSP